MILSAESKLLYDVTFTFDELDDASLPDQVPSSNDHEVAPGRVQVGLNPRAHLKVSVIEQFPQYWSYGPVKYYPCYERYRNL